MREGAPRCIDGGRVEPSRCGAASTEASAQHVQRGRAHAWVAFCGRICGSSPSGWPEDPPDTGSATQLVVLVILALHREHTNGAVNTGSKGQGAPMRGRAGESVGKMACGKAYHRRRALDI